METHESIDREKKKICENCLKELSHRGKIFTQASTFTAENKCYWCESIIPKGEIGFWWFSPLHTNNRPEFTIKQLFAFLNDINDPHDIVRPYEHEGDTQTIMNQKDVMDELRKYFPNEFTKEQKLRLFYEYHHILSYYKKNIWDIFS